MMRSFLSLVLLAAMPALAFADEATDVLKKDAHNYAKAFVASDHESLVRYIHPRMIEDMGGKEASIAELKRVMDRLAGRGISFEELTVGEPGKLTRAGKWLVSLVPTKVITKGRSIRSERESHLVGFSEDEGKNWVFVDAAPFNDAKLNHFFPELAGKVKLPEKKKPVETPVEK